MRSTTRSFALRARGLTWTSSPEASIGRGVSRRKIRAGLCRGSGHSGRSIHSALRSRKNVFTMRSSSEWKLIDSKARTVGESEGDGFQTARQDAEFVIYGDSKRLEDSGGRMSRSRSRDHRCDGRSKVKRCANRTLFAQGGDARCDMHGAGLFTVLAKNSSQFGLARGRIDDIGCRAADCCGSSACPAGRSSSSRSRGSAVSS